MDIDKIIQRIREKFLKESPKPESQDEKDYYRQVFWEDPSEVTVTDPDGNPVDFEEE